MTLDDKSVADNGAVRAPSNLIVSLVAPETAVYRIAVSANGQLSPGEYGLLVTLPSNPPPDFFVRARA